MMRREKRARGRDPHPDNTTTKNCPPEFLLMATWSGGTKEKFKKKLMTLVQTLRYSARCMSRFNFVAQRKTCPDLLPVGKA